MNSKSLILIMYCNLVWFSLVGGCSFLTGQLSLTWEKSWNSNPHQENISEFQLQIKKSPVLSNSGATLLGQGCTAASSTRRTWDPVAEINTATVTTSWGILPTFWGGDTVLVIPLRGQYLRIWYRLGCQRWNFDICLQCHTWATSRFVPLTVS